MRKYFVILISSIFLFSNVAYASMAVPVLPYIPPETVSFFDYIFNMKGVTAPAISNDTERLDAYLKLYKASLPLIWQNAWNSITGAFDKAKTSGKIEIDEQMNTELNTVISYALQNGIQYGESYPASLTAQQWQTRLQNQYGIYGNISVFNAIYSGRATEYVHDTESYLLFVIGKKAGSDYPQTIDTITFMTMATAYGTSAKVQMYSNGYYYPMYLTGSIANRPASVNFYVYNWDSENRTIGTFIHSASGGCAFHSISEQGSTAAYSGETLTIQAKTQAVYDGIVNNLNWIMSAFSILLNGEIDTSQAQAIPVPAVDYVPATTTADVEAQQQQQGVSDVDSGTDVNTLHQQLQQAYQEIYGDTNEYALDLTEYFPFCIPFDIGRIIELLVAEPEAPSFTFNFPSGYNEGEIMYTEQEFNLSVFDPVAFVLRKGLDLVFIVGLGVITREKFLRG